MRGKSLLHRGSLTLEERYYGNARSFSDEQLRTVLPDFNPGWTHTDVTAGVYAQSQGWDPVARMQHIDLFTWLRGDILVKADKMTMANSLELRVPFLDPEVFAVASRLPFDQKITRTTTKYALRRALEPIVPAHVLNRAKLGLPGAHPALAAIRRTDGLGLRHDRRLAGRSSRRPRRRCARCSTSTAPGRATTADGCGRC